jgi:hypothetical protein
VTGLIWATLPQVKMPQQGVPDAGGEVVVIEGFAVPVAEDVVREVRSRCAVRPEGVADGLSNLDVACRLVGLGRVGGEFVV